MLSRQGRKARKGYKSGDVGKESLASKAGKVGIAVKVGMLTM